MTDNTENSQLWDDQFIDERDAFLANLKELKAGRTTSTIAENSDLDSLINQAALESTFTPEELATSVGVKLTDKLTDGLLNASQPVRTGEGKAAWELNDTYKRSAMKRLMDGPESIKALAFEKLRSSDFVENRLLGQMLSEKSPSLSSLELAELLEVSKISRILTGIVDVIDQNRLNEVIERKSFLFTLEKLIGGKFAGRKSELAMLQHYVVHGSLPGSRKGKYRPLLIRGPGGMGKSTLLAQFLLNKVCQTQPPKYPFAYLDFDRRILSVEYPATLLNDVLRQLAIFYPQHSEPLLQLRDSWRARLQINSSGLGVEYAQSTQGLESRGFSDARLSSEFIREFCDTLNDIWLLDNKPLVLIFDTFEEVQGRSRDYIAELGRFLDELRFELSAVGEMRVILSGRVEVDPAHFPTYEHELKELDTKESEIFLQGLGVDPMLTPLIVAQVSGVPLTLRFASELILSEQDRLLALGDLVGFDPVWFLIWDDRLLYRRYLNQIHDPDIKKLVHPGIVLRIVTPEIIEKVLAEPCGINISDDGPASASESDVGNNNDPVTSPRSTAELFDALSKEVSLVSFGANNVLKHRPNVRKLLLPLINTDEAKKVEQINKNAVRYYEDLGDSADIRQRAEEIYHRLQLKQPEKIIGERWLSGVESELRNCVEELPPESQVILASRIGQDSALESLASTEFSKIDQVSWELYAIRKAQTSIKFNTPQEALDVLAERKGRLAGSELYPLEATLFKHVSNWEAMRDTAMKGMASAASAGNKEMATELVNLLFQSYRFSGDYDGALSMMKTARQMIDERNDLESLNFHLRLDLVELQIGELTQADKNRELEQTALGRLRDLLALKPTARFARVCRRAVGELGDEYPEIVEKVLCKFGIDSTNLNEPRIGLLTEAFANWDELVSEERGKPAGVLAEKHDLMLSPELQWQNLSELQESNIVDAMLDAYEDPSHFGSLFLKGLDENLTRFFSSSSGGSRKVLFDVVRHFKGQSRLGEFMNALKSEFPENRKIQDLGDETVGAVASYRSAWESFVRRLADGKRVGVQGLIRDSIKEFGLPIEAAPKFVQFFALPDESAALAPAYTKLIGSLDDKSIDLLAQRIVGIDLIDRSDKAKTLLREAYQIGRFQDLICAAREQIELQTNKTTIKEVKNADRSQHIDIASGEGEAWRSLHKALMDAFPSSLELKQLMELLNDKLDNYFGVHMQMEAWVENIIRKYNEDSRIDDLVRAAIQEKPNNGFLRAFALERGIETQIPSTQSDLVPAGESLERMLDPDLGFINPMDLINKMGEIVNAVCRIEVGGKTMGTGFLIGPNIVMTTFHLLENVIKNNNPELVKIRFDYKSSTNADDPIAGTEHVLDQNNWLIEHSPYDPNDRAFKLREETLALERAADFLDFAIVRTAGRPADDLVGEPQVKRGYLRIPETGPNHRKVFGKDSGIFIFQHPRGMPLRVDFTPDADFDLDRNQTRVIYDANTQPGTAGAPCFNNRLELIAMHESRGPDSDADSEDFYKQGIPIDKIRENLQLRGTWKEIC